MKLSFRLPLRLPKSPFLTCLRRSVVATMAVRLAILLAVILGASCVPSAKAQGVTLASGLTVFVSNVCPSGQTTPAPCSQTLSLTYNVTAITAIGNIEVLTQGASDLDFKAVLPSTVGEGACPYPQTYFPGQTCTLHITFAPLAPGQRNGAVVILDGSGHVLASTNIYGIGIAPAIAFSPSPQAPIGSGFTAPAGVAVDGSGNVFVADSAKAKVYEVLAAGFYTTVKSLGGSFAFSAPGGVALDGSGNVFVTDSGTAKVYEILASGGYTTVDTLASTFAFGGPSGIALDGSGNVFVGDYINGAVYEILAPGGYTTVNNLTAGTVAGTYFKTQPPAGIAVDVSGNLFVADPSGAAVYEILAAGGYTTINALGDGSSFISLNGWNYPSGVALDAAGDVFVTDSGYPYPLQILAVGGYSTVVPLGGGFVSPRGVALDGSGNVYVSDSGNKNVQEILRSRPPALALHFVPTPVGGTSIDSPKGIQFQNIGNEALTGTGVLSDYTDFTAVAGPGTVPDCNPGTLSLAAGAECNLSFKFTPQSGGMLSSTLSLSDNALNGNPATQTVQLGGTGLVAPQITALSPDFGAIAAFVTITGSNFGAAEGSGYVQVNGAKSQVIAWSDTAITVRVPYNGAPGAGSIVVTADGGKSNPEPFTLLAFPTIAGVSVATGIPGTPVTITGTNLLDSSGHASVTFNGTPATIVSDTATSIQVTVPAGATSGRLNIAVNGVPLIALQDFVVTPSLPNITAISPNYGAIAAYITINGNFDATQGNGYVTVGGGVSEVTAWSRSQITIRAPYDGSTGNVIVRQDSKTSNGVPFTLYPFPTITGTAATSGDHGTLVTITGTNLLDGGGKASVTFNGVSGTIVGDTATSIQASVPSAVSSGSLLVRVNGVSLAETVATSPISIVPASANVAAGGSIQLTARGGAGITWEVNGIAGGNASVGVISTDGLYTASQTAGAVVISAVDPAIPATPGKASVSILAPHRFGVRTTSSLAQFYDRASGNAFTPRGNNYVRLAMLTDPDGSPDYTHSTFSVGLYDSARAEAALSMMQTSGYNVVRVFLWGCCDGTIGDPAGGLSSAYIQNVVDFLQRARTHAIGVIFTSQWLPVYGGYTDSLGDCQPQFDDINLTNLSSCGVNATRKFFHDYVQALVNAGAPLDAIFAYDLWNEYYYNAIAAPLNTTSGTVTTANGKTYDMSSAASQQQMMDDGLAYFADQNRSAILAIDPTALVTMSFFTPQGPNPTRIGDFRIIEVYPAVANSTLDYVDLHAYPIASSLTMDQFAENFGFVGYQQKMPILMGEFGAFTADYASVMDAATGLQGWQTQSCAYNFQGWLLWTWDTDEQTELWNALSQTGAINQSLSPAERPNPCSA